MGLKDTGLESGSRRIQVQRFDWFAFLPELFKVLEGMLSRKASEKNGALVRTFSTEIRAAYNRLHTAVEVSDEKLGMRSRN